ncbi:hypothetical protein SAMN05444161_7657 [Rhizobiales bacterium GAS191]|jgi:hypothetical protein|nr:hypothetical protein SAMN05519103_06943 [Rhizobiales bacterium GAS113]SED57213.1 hypothetical protein SAMN05519104_3839 [Rhizobiales bacterium GAS188]SEE88769.1 hypothetical protein SAMN05444161_7657 [Rhizobiales bacterium GAS191]
MIAQDTITQDMVTEMPVAAMPVARKPVARNTAAKSAAKPAGKARPPLKVRHEPPTLEEAIYAAQGVTTDVEQQIELAADLMDLPIDEVRPQVLKAIAKPSTTNRVFVPARSGLQRAVVIETTGRSRNRVSSDLAGRVTGRVTLRPLQVETLRTRMPS